MSAEPPVEILRQGPDAWNDWRTAMPNPTPDLRGCDLEEFNLAGADLSHANLSEAKLVGLIHGSFGSMSGHYHGIRGLESSHGNRIFVRDAADQDFLDTMRRHIDRTPPGPLRAIRKVLFRGWGAIGYGRSLGPPTMYALGLAGMFGCIYSLDMWLGWGLMDYSGTAHSPFTPFYYSIVTYTTLGFGDITPIHWLGEIIIVIEVVLGYLTLGLLLSILANTVARRS